MLESILQNFVTFVEQQPNLELHNEAGLQHESALFLRDKLEPKYRVQLEGNIKTLYVNGDAHNLQKKEIEILLKTYMTLWSAIG